MPSIHLDAKTGIYQDHFRLFGKRFNRSLSVKDEEQAGRLKAEYDDAIARGRLRPPAEVEFNSKQLWHFIKT